MSENSDSKPDSQNSDSANNSRKALRFVAILAVGTIGILVIAIGFSNEDDLKGNQVNQILEPIIKKAAIINMLHDKYPNPDFVQNATSLLEQNGYLVDVYLTEDVTIDFYKKLPKFNYELIVFRTHSLNQGTIEESTSIFSGEVYSNRKHVDEQWAEQIGFAVPYTPYEVKQIGWENLGNQTYFTIGSKFVNEVMEGEFSDTQIIIGGCDSLSGDILAKSLVDKGASFVIGWDDLVTPDNNDDGMLLVLAEIVNGSLPIEATTKAMSQLEIEPSLNSKLTFYSSEA